MLDKKKEDDDSFCKIFSLKSKKKMWKECEEWITQWWNIEINKNEQHNATVNTKFHLITNAG